METTLEKLKKLERILEQGNAPILKYFNAGLKREEVVTRLLQKGIYLNESLISLYQWHNGVKYEYGDNFLKIQIFANATFYTLEWALERREELIDWEIVDYPDQYLPIFGSLEGEMYLLKNDLQGEIYYLSPKANIYGEMQIKSLDKMLDMIFDCYNEKIFEIDPNKGISYIFMEFLNKKKNYQ